MQTSTAVILRYHKLRLRLPEGQLLAPDARRAIELAKLAGLREVALIGVMVSSFARVGAIVAMDTTVYSFDHAAVNDDVVACDMAHVPLDDESLDVAIFSLTLMGANFADYIREAHRTLKLDGQLHIIEATERFTDRAQFTKALKGIGFGGIDVEDNWKFTHIQARKTERRPREGVALRF